MGNLVTSYFQATLVCYMLYCKHTFKNLVSWYKYAFKIYDSKMYNH